MIDDGLFFGEKIHVVNYFFLKVFDFKNFFRYFV